MNLKLPWWLAIYALVRTWMAEFYRRGLLWIYFTSYLASISRVLSWAIVAGAVYRYQSTNELAVLMLIRGVTGLFLILPMSLTPGLVHYLTRPSKVLPVARQAGTHENCLEYQTNIVVTNNDSLFLTSVFAIGLYSVCVSPIAYIYQTHLNWFHQIKPSLSFDASVVAFGLAFGTILRGFSETFAARLQAERKQLWDNCASVLCELLFVIFFIQHAQQNAIQSAAYFFFISSLCLFLYRFLLVFIFKFEHINRVHIQFRFADQILIFVSVIWVLLSQFSDWLYASFNQVLMDRYLDVSVIAHYAPAIQIDGALLLLISGISISLFPLSAMRFHDRQWSELRASYLRSTLVSLIILGCGAGVTCLISRWLFIRWFGNSMDVTRAILPYVLIHTVIGGTASIGRSVLFGMGRMKPYAIASIIGGASNAVLATLVVILKPEWGLMGIIGVTIFTVTIRCAFWLPWYTLHAIREEETRSGLAR